MKTLLKKEFFENRYLFSIAGILCLAAIYGIIFLDHVVLMLLFSLPAIVNMIIVLKYSAGDYMAMMIYPIKKYDLIKEKYFINILSTIIMMIFIGAYMLKSDRNVELLKFFTLIMMLFMSVYSLAIPLMLKYGRQSPIITIITLFPLMTKPIVKIVDSLNLNSLEINFSYFYGVLMIVYLLIYISGYLVSRRIIDKKDF